MRVVVATTDREAIDWLRALLGSAGISVAVIEDARPNAPELSSAELLIADSSSAGALGDAGPKRRLLLVPRGHAVDMGRALDGGFMDVLIVPSTDDDVLARVGRALDHFLPPAAAKGGPDRVSELRDLVDRVTGALRTSKPNTREAARETAEGMLSVFLLLTDSHETTDRGTPGHSRRVASIARDVLMELGGTSDAAAWLELAGRLHDIGLVALGLPLSGEAALDLELRRRVEQHPRLGADILDKLASWGLPIDAVRAHHERIDGSGYPGGLHDEDIAIEAKIMAAADVYEALTSPRPWRPAEPRDEALAAMRTSGGFDPDVLAALERVTARSIEPPGPPPVPPDPPGGRR